MVKLKLYRGFKLLAFPSQATLNASVRPEAFHTALMILKTDIKNYATSLAKTLKTNSRSTIVGLRSGKSLGFLLKKQKKVSKHPNNVWQAIE